MIHVLLLLMSLNTTEPKGLSVDFDFQMNGKPVNRDKMSVYLLHNGSKLLLSEKAFSFTIHDSLFRERFDIVFRYRKKDYIFNNLYVNTKKSDHQWKVNIDSRPFEKGDYWTIEDFKNIKCIYTLDRGNGTVIFSSQLKNRRAGRK